MVTKRLKQSTEEAASLKTQLTAAAQESQGLRQQLSKLTSQAADTERRLNEEVGLHACFLQGRMAVRAGLGSSCVPVMGLFSSCWIHASL